METKDLRKKYEEACNAYLTKFIKKHDYQLEPYPWVGDEVGGVACIGDMFVGFNDIRYDIDHDVPEEYFDKWYWRSVEMYEAHLAHPDDVVKNLFVRDDKKKHYYLLNSI